MSVTQSFRAGSKGNAYPLHMIPTLKKYRIRKTSDPKPVKPLFVFILWHFFKMYALFGIVLWESQILKWAIDVQHLFLVLVILKTIMPAVLILLSFVNHMIDWQPKEMMLTEEQANMMAKNGFEVEEVKPPQTNAK